MYLVHKSKKTVRRQYMDSGWFLILLSCEQLLSAAAARVAPSGPRLSARASNGLWLRADIRVTALMHLGCVYVIRVRVYVCTYVCICASFVRIIAYMNLCHVCQVCALECSIRVCNVGVCQACVLLFGNLLNCLGLE